MLDEEIILLVKEFRHEEAIQRYVDKQKYDKAEEFCLKQDKKLGLLTILLSIYFKQYTENEQEFKRVIESKQPGSVSNALQYQQKAEFFRDQALNLLRNHSSKNQLDPLQVLKLIPDNWQLKTKEYNLLGFLSSIFDHQMTIEENSQISKNLSKMEQLHTEHELNELKTAYIVIGDDSICKVCKRKLKPKNIRIFPNGGVFH